MPHHGIGGQILKNATSDGANVTICPVSPVQGWVSLARNETSESQISL